MNTHNTNPSDGFMPYKPYEWGPSSLWQGRIDCDLDFPLGCINAFIISLGETQ
jgi:hypothetical protein